MNTNARSEPAIIKLKDLTEHIRKLKRPAYGFFVSPDIWDGLKERVPEGNAIWGSPIMVDPCLGKERFDIAFDRESFNERAAQISKQA